MRNTARSLLGLLMLIILGLGAVYIHQHPDMITSPEPHITEAPDTPQQTEPTPDATANDQSGELHKITQQLNVERKANQPLRAKIKELISKDILTQNRNTQQENQLKKLRKGKTTTDQELQELQSAVAKSETITRNQSTETEKLTAHLAIANTQLGERQTQVAELEKRATQTESELKSSQDAQRLADQDIQKLKGEITKLKQQLAAAQKAASQAAAATPTAPAQ